MVSPVWPPNYDELCVLYSSLLLTPDFLNTSWVYQNRELQLGSFSTIPWHKKTNGVQSCTSRVQSWHCAFGYSHKRLIKLQASLIDFNSSRSFSSKCCFFIHFPCNVFQVASGISGSLTDPGLLKSVSFSSQIWVILGA